MRLTKLKKIVFGKDEVGEYHEGNPIIRLQENGMFEVLCPFGHLIAYDIPAEFVQYYKKPIRCYGSVRCGDEG